MSPQQQKQQTTDSGAKIKLQQISSRDEESGQKSRADFLEMPQNQNDDVMRSATDQIDMKELSNLFSDDNEEAKRQADPPIRLPKQQEVVTLPKQSILRTSNSFEDMSEKSWGANSLLRNQKQPDIYLDASSDDENDNSSNQYVVPVQATDFYGGSSRAQGPLKTIQVHMISDSSIRQNGNVTYGSSSSQGKVAFDQDTRPRGRGRQDKNELKRKRRNQNPNDSSSSQPKEKRSKSNLSKNYKSVQFDDLSNQQAQGQSFRAGKLKAKKHSSASGAAGLMKSSKQEHQQRLKNAAIKSQSRSGAETAPHRTLTSVKSSKGSDASFAQYVKNNVPPVKRSLTMQKKLSNESAKSEASAGKQNLAVAKLKTEPRMSSNIVKTKDGQIQKKISRSGLIQSNQHSFIKKTQEAVRNTGIEFLINEKIEESRLSLVWSKIILLIHTYNFVTVFFFLGIEGFPEGIWLLLEIVSELLITVDFILRLILRLKCPTIWAEMWLLHDKGTRSKFHLTIRLIGSIPQSLILCLIYAKNLQALRAFHFALLRCCKLLRLRQISQYFEKVDFQNKRSKKNSFLQGFMVVYYFFLATHLIGCIWLLVARLEADKNRGWFQMANFNEYEVTTFDQYIESLFFVVATMTGLGYGNIVPSTNPEWLVDCFIMIIGASIYANFFANFAVEIYKQNLNQIDNDEKFDQAKQFIQQRQVSDDLKKKVRYYFNDLRMNFKDFTKRYEILEELPSSLKGEISLVFNRELVQSVKFFQLAEPDFIMAISRLLKPKISIQGEYVVRIDEVATKMFFVNSGIVEILASDDKTTLAYQGQGCYFGEIGIFLTGKRSCSVRVKQSAILFKIGKTELFKMLEPFPMQAKFLRAVGRQRLQTTDPEDIKGADDADFERFQREELGREAGAATQTEGILNRMHSIRSNNVPDSQRMKQSHKDPRYSFQESKLQMDENLPLSHSRQFSKIYTDLKRRPKIWQTKNFNKFDYFLIVPFSVLFYIWNSLLMTTVFYDTFMVPFSIALSFDFYGAFYAIDVFAILIYCCDIFMRSKLAITRPSALCFDKQKVMRHYVNSWLIMDLLACIPFEYFMLYMSDSFMDFIRYVRLFRLMKFGRVYELIQLIQTQSEFSSRLFVFVKLFCLFILSAHFMACIYIYIGMHEVDGGGRFDGQTMFGDLLNRNFITLKPATEMGPLELYWQFLYLSSCTMGAVMYGDVIPMTKAEQLFTFTAMFGARIFLAFVFAEAANYLSQLHVSKSIHNQKMKRILTWMKHNNFPKQLVERVNDYHKMLWEDFKGIDEQQILKDLPESLSHDIRTHLLHSLIMNWEAFPKNNSEGAAQTVIRKLKLVVIPKNEYIIRVGQIAEDMSFIVKGICRVLSADGQELAILKQGQNFGEMALLDPESPLRQANVVSITKCSLAVLTKKDFNMICEMYPAFQSKIFEQAKQRKIANLQKEKDAKILKMQTTTELGVLEEEKSSDNSNSEYGSQAASQRQNVSATLREQIENQNIVTQIQGRSSSQQMFARGSIETEIPALRNSIENNDQADIQSGGGNQNSLPSIRVCSNNSDYNDEEVEESNRLDLMSPKPNATGASVTNEENLSLTPMTPLANPFSPDKQSEPIAKGSQKRVREFNEPGKHIVDHLADGSSEPQESDRLNTGNVREESDVLLPGPKRVTFGENVQDSLDAPLREKGKQDDDSTRAHRQSNLKTGKQNALSPRESLFDTQGRYQNRIEPEMGEEALKRAEILKKRSMITVESIESYIKNQDTDDASKENFLTKCLSIKKATLLCIKLVSIYNLVFVPLSLAFRIKFQGVFLFLEVATIFFYMVDICLRWSKLNNLYQLEKIPDSRLNEADRKLKNDPEQLHRNIRIQKIEIGCSVAGCLPFVSALSFLEIYKPWPLISIFSMVRLVKIRPVFQVFNSLKNRNLNFWRIMEVLTYYYLICHIIACVLLQKVAFEPDARETWLRRIPVPQEDGIREEKSIFTDMSGASIYIHSFYFVVNTVSHVAIGDITSVTTHERVFNSLLILLGTFIYCFLFGNITAIVSSLAPSQNMQFYRQYNFVMSKLKNGRTPLKTLVDVDQYFDVQWSLYKGLDVEHALQPLPESIKSDILLSRYSDTVETSLLFRESSGQIDVALASSIFKKFRIQIYQNQEFILKVGQHCTDTIIILDGQVQVYGLNDRETLGILSAGSHFSNDLAGDKLQASLAKFISIQKSHLKMFSVEDNFDNKSLIHLVAKSYVVVGTLSQNDMQNLYVAYPKWKNMMQTFNRFLFELCKISLEKYTASLDKPIVRQECAKLLQNHLTFSTERTYEDILENDIYSSQITVVDLTRILKHHYIQLISQSITHEQRTNLQRACMMRHLSVDTQKASYNVQEKGCCKDLHIKPNSKPRRVLELLQLLNLIYIAFSTPMYISFKIRMVGLAMLLECVSLILSLFVIILNFRTPIIVKGKMTLEFSKVATYYWQNGILIDLCGILPFNLIFQQQQELENLDWLPLTLVLVLQGLRIVSSWQALKIFAQFEVYIKSHNFLMGTLKATLMLYFLAHWMTCSWHLVNVLEARVGAETWAVANNLDEKTVSERYLLCYYAVLNVVTSVGYGDMFPITDLERIFFILMINAGDVLFALAFGLLAQITMQQTRNNENQKFVDKMLSMQQMMAALNISQSQRDRVDKYFSFIYYKRTNSTMIDHNDLAGLVPHSLVKEIIFHQNFDMLYSMFKDFKSENLIKELSTVLQFQIFLPYDYIINKGEIGEEMYFILEGEVLIIASDKQTIVTTIHKGQYFGEIAIYFSTKRTSYVQAATFCILNSLKKVAFDRIVKSFPLVAKDIYEKAKERMRTLAQFNETPRRNVVDARGQMFNNLLDESLLSDDDTNNDEGRTEVTHQILLSEDSDPDIQRRNMNDQIQRTLFRPRANTQPAIKGHNSHIQLMEEKAEPMIVAMHEHMHALDPKSQKVIQAVQEHAPRDSEIKRKSTLLLSGGGQSVTPDSKMPPRSTLAVNHRGSHQSLVQDNDDPLVSKSKMRQVHRQGSHRSILTGGSGGRRDTMSSKSHALSDSASQISSMFGGPSRRGLDQADQASMHQQNQQASNDHEAITVRRLVKRERRLSRITLNRNLTLNQTAGLKLQWTVGN